MKKLKNPVLLIFILLFSCKKESQNPSTLFQLLSIIDTGIDFRNELSYTEQVNPYTFRNFYNGAGIALGDINNDGLLDIFFAGNQTSNKLYLNQGNLKFKDITQSAGLESAGYWSTGVSMADINGDGLLSPYRVIVPLPLISNGSFKNVLSSHLVNFQFTIVFQKHYPFLIVYFHHFYLANISLD